MNELREIKLLCFHFSTIFFQAKLSESSPGLDSPGRLQFHSPFAVPCFEDCEPKQPPCGNEVQRLFLSANFLYISVVPLEDVTAFIS